MRERIAGRAALRGAGRIVLWLVTSAVTLQSYLLLTYSQDYRSKAQRPLHRFQGMVRGEAPKPFVARVVVPYLVRRVGESVPRERAAGFVSPLRRAGFHFPRNVSFSRSGQIDPRQYAAWIYLALVSLVLLAEGIYRSLVLHYSGGRGLFVGAAAASVLMWPMWIAYGSFMIDAFTPTIVVWTMYAAFRRRWIVYVLLLGIAALHKETMVTIPLALGYYFYRQWPLGRWAAFVTAQVAGVVLVRGYLSFVVFAANEGSFVQFHLFGHNASLDVWRGFLPKLVLLFVLIAGLVLRDIGSKPRGCKAMAITVLPLLVMGVVSGYFDELRQYAEGYPGLVSLAFPTLANSFGRDLVRARSEGTGRSKLAASARAWP